MSFLGASMTRRDGGQPRRRIKLDQIHRLYGWSIVEGIEWSSLTMPIGCTKPAVAEEPRCINAGLREPATGTGFGSQGLSP